MDEYRNFMKYQGFVLQFPHFFNKFTVEEELTYAAMLRLPDTMTYEQILERVQGVIDLTKLAKQRSTVIGAKEGGLSGGQKRRLSVAIELLRAPSILFLDEPTSGLDAKSSLDLAILLADLAYTGR
eukprot:UN25980